MRPDFAAPNAFSGDITVERTPRGGASLQHLARYRNVNSSRRLYDGTALAGIS
jgi:hypothetical protein